MLEPYVLPATMTQLERTGVSCRARQQQHNMRSGCDEAGSAPYREFPMGTALRWLAESLC